MAKIFTLIALLIWSLPSSADIIQSYPILERLLANGHGLSGEAEEWMDKWRGLDLEETQLFIFDEFSGQTSINLKIKLIDPTEEDGSKSYGSFVTRNSSANFDLEVAYYNMAAILDVEKIYRPAAPYNMGPRAMAEFKRLLLNTEFQSEYRIANKQRILNAMERGAPLRGCLKAKSKNSEREYNEIGSGRPSQSHPVIASLQANKAKPVPGETVRLANGYVGDAYELAREYSIAMTMDAIFQQWDRYSGSNVSISKDSAGNAHFYFSDNGGADMNSGTSWLEKNLGWFSRYDRKTIATLRELHRFLENPASGYLGYRNAEDFVQDLGLLTEHKASTYADRLKRNIGRLLEKVRDNEARYGNDAYLD